MRSTRRGTHYPLLGFVLVALVVLGGMAWATVSTVRLAESDIVYQVSLALWRMDSHIDVIMTKEAGRPYTDYVGVHTPKLLLKDGSEPHPREYEDYLLPSPLALSKPEHDWIELYFQVNQDDVWSSPQIPGDSEPWIPDSPYSDVDTVDHLRSTLHQVQASLTPSKLRALDRRARECNCPLRERPGHEHCDCLRAVHIAQREAARTGRAALSNDYQRRHRSQAASQLKSVPPQQCVDRAIADYNIRKLAPVDRSQLDDALLDRTAVEISRWLMEPFWLDPANSEGLRMAFVRTGYADGEPFHQGFVGDWDQLKPELLAKIDDLFPDADLLPVLGDDSQPDDETSGIAMSTIPVRLGIPDLAGGTRAAAWRSVRGILLATWAATVAILIAAGWGIRNLLALTERRMQFAYAVTHELRTPLTTFRLYSDMLSAGLVPESSNQEYLDTLNRESVRLSSLVEGVLEYARLENQRVRLNPSETDASSLLKVIREGLEEHCGQNGVEGQAQSEIPDGTPLHVDVDVVNRIVSVLVSNACRHARGAEHPNVTIRLAGENGKIHLDVIDSGPGVNRRDVRRIFKPFRRGWAADAAAGGGIGLGLALARSWAKLLGGRLDLVAHRHPKHGGAHFRLTIPAQMPSRR